MNKNIWLIWSLVFMFFITACEKQEMEEKPYLDQVGKNLLTGWHGMGKMQPNEAGWKSSYSGSDFPWGSPDGSAGCRYRTPGKTLPKDYLYDDGEKFNSIELMLRYDNNKYEGALLYYKTNKKLYKGATYRFSFDYHVGNGGEKALIVGFSSSNIYEELTGKSQDGKGGDIEIQTMKDIVYQEHVTTEKDAKVWKSHTLTFQVADETEHYLFFNGDRDWFGVANLKLEVVE